MPEFGPEQFQSKTGVSRQTLSRLKAYADMIMALPEMQEWIEAAKAEPADIEELEVEY